jgi:hypothetical protein
MSQSLLGLMFERVCACKKLTEITSTPSWSSIRSGGTPSNPDARSCARSWAVDQGTGAHQQSREPPGSSCCLSLLADWFWPTTIWYYKYYWLFLQPWSHIEQFNLEQTHKSLYLCTKGVLVYVPGCLHTLPSCKSQVLVVPIWETCSAILFSQPEKWAFVPGISTSCILSQY